MARDLHQVIWMFANALKTAAKLIATGVALGLVMIVVSPIIERAHQKTIRAALPYRDRLIISVRNGCDTRVIVARLRSNGCSVWLSDRADPSRKERRMTTYISLLRFTQQGVEKIKESPARLDRAKAAAKAGGGELKAFYLTMGHYDAVVIAEAPSDEVYAGIMLAIGAAGAVRTESLRAFSEEEYRKIVGSIR